MIIQIVLYKTGAIVTISEPMSIGLHVILAN